MESSKEGENKNPVSRGRPIQEVILCEVTAAWCGSDLARDGHPRTKTQGTGDTGGRGPGPRHPVGETVWGGGEEGINEPRALGRFSQALNVASFHFG